MTGGRADRTVPPSSADLDLDGFRAQLGTIFEVQAGGERVPLQLVEAVDGGTGGGFRRFSILFHGPAERPLAQATYEFHHSTLGPLTLFIVPVIGSNAERMVYQASLSRPVAP